LLTRNNRALDIANAWLQTKDGWYSIGRYAQGPGPEVYNWKLDGFQGLLIRDVPGAATPLIVPAAPGVDRKWGMRSPHRFGLFEANAPDGYVALSAAFIRDDGADERLFDGQGMVHEAELTVPAQWERKLWDDSGTHSNDVGAAWAVRAGAVDDARTHILVVPGGQTRAWLFHGQNGNQNQPTWTPRTLDLSKCKLLQNHYV
jgi:hypothetical protein